MRLWKRLNLAQRYGLASLVVLVAGMTAIGWWVSEKIRAGVVQNSAASAALYLTSFVAPRVQELAVQERLSRDSVEALDRLYRETPLHERVRAFKIWGRGGRLVYASEPAIADRVFPVTASQQDAWDGTVTAELSDLDQDENVLERKLGIPLLEIYSPVRDHAGDRIIAVAEFYDAAESLAQNLEKARTESWMVVAVVTLGMYALLFGIVGRGSETITRQQRELQARIQQLSGLLRSNSALHERAQRATSRAVELNERFLRRVSAELHDGPAQALAFALLRLDAALDHSGLRAAGTRCDADKPSGDLDTIRQSLQEALGDIRSLASGLAMPELAGMNLSESLQQVVRAHQRRTRSDVDLRLGAVPENLPLPLKIGIYRFVQEALSNGFRHGKGKAQRVGAQLEDGALRVLVSDAGPGFDPAQRPPQGDQLGLSGMRERIESLGGKFAIESAPSQGTRVTACFPIETLRVDHE